MKLRGGPADGHDVPAARETWVWVAVDSGRVRIFDLTRTLAQQPVRVRGADWHEYTDTPTEPGVYQWARRLPTPA